MKESRGFAHWFQKAHPFPFCSAGQASLIDLLVSKGAVVNATDYHGSTPLHLACQKGYQSVTVSSCALLEALQGWPLLCATWLCGISASLGSQAPPPESAGPKLLGVD